MKSVKKSVFINILGLASLFAVTAVSVVLIKNATQINTLAKGALGKVDYNVGIQYYPKNTVADEFINNWNIHKNVVSKDLDKIKSEGFTLIRILLLVQHYGDSTTTWGEGGRKVFFQDLRSGDNYYSKNNPFAPPTQAQIANLKEYIDLIKSKGLQFEVVTLLSDADSRYYARGASDDHFRNWYSVVIPMVRNMGAKVIYMAGDIQPGRIPDHANFLKTQFPYFNSLCGTRCNTGIEVGTLHNTLSDLGVESIHWIKNNLTVMPKVVGVQIYPTSKNYMFLKGYVLNNPSGLNIEYGKKYVFNWQKLLTDFWKEITEAAGGSFKIYVDEANISTTVTTSKSNYTGFTEEEQRDFLQEAINFFKAKTPVLNIWAYYDLRNNLNDDSEANYGIKKFTGEDKASVAYLAQTLKVINNCNYHPFVSGLATELASPGSSYEIKCSFNSGANSNLDSIGAISEAGACKYLRFEGKNAVFSCSSNKPGIYRNYCTNFSGTAANSCPQRIQINQTEIGNTNSSAKCNMPVFINGSLSISNTINKGQSYKVKCNYDKIYDSIGVKSTGGSCTYETFEGKTAVFNCIGNTSGNHKNYCITVMGTRNDTCYTENQVGNIKIN